MFGKSSRITAFTMAGILTIGIAFTGCTKANVSDIKKDPLQSVEDAMKLSLEKFFDVSVDPTEAIEAVSKKGEINFYAEVEDTKIDNTLYIDSENTNYFDQASITSGEETIEASAFLTKDTVGVKAESLLGNEYYGTKIDGDLITKIQKSALMAKLDESEQSSQLFDALKGVSIDAVKSDYKQAIDNFTNTLKGFEAIVQKEKIEVSGKKVNTVSVSYKVDNEFFKNLIEAYETFSADSTKSIMDIYEKLGAANYTEMMSSSYDSIKEELNDYTLDGVVKFYIANDMLVMSDVNVKATNNDDSSDVENVEMRFSFGADPAKSDEIAMTYALTGENAASVNAVLKKVDTDAELCFDLNMTVKESDNDPQEAKAEFKISKATDTYNLLIEAGEDKTTVSGTFACTPTNFKISVDSIVSNDEETIVKFGITGTTETTMPETPTEVVDIFELNDEELDEKFGTILTMLGMGENKLPDDIDINDYDLSDYDLSDYDLSDYDLSDYDFSDFDASDIA